MPATMVFCFWSVKRISSWPARRSRASGLVCAGCRRTGPALCWASVGSDCPKGFVRRPVGPLGPIGTVYLRTFCDDTTMSVRPSVSICVCILVCPRLLLGRVTGVGCAECLARRFAGRTTTYTDRYDSMWSSVTVADAFLYLYIARRWRWRRSVRPT